MTPDEALRVLEAAFRAANKRFENNSLEMTIKLKPGKFEELQAKLCAMTCAPGSYRVESVEEFEAAFKAALASGRPTLIDAAITRLALPHYSPSPAGLLAGIWEMVRKRFGLASR